MEWCGCTSTIPWICSLMLLLLLLLLLMHRRREHFMLIACRSVYVCVCHSPKTESLGVKRICTTCIHNHISFSRVFQCDELECAWSSSVKIYDYLCKRLLITAARSHVKQNEKLMAACSLWRYMRRRMKGVNKWEKREKQSKELVWFIVFYWLIEWSLVVTPDFFSGRSINTRHLKIEEKRKWKSTEREREKKRRWYS